VLKEKNLKRSFEVFSTRPGPGMLISVKLRREREKKHSFKELQTRLWN
jgi:hypothetical protein